MNCLFLNVRGINATRRKPFILDTLAKTQASIVAFQETKKEEYSDSYLKSISANKKFNWHHLPAKGSVGGILVGVDVDLFDIISWDS